jgi:hypothetical protein
MFSNRIKKIQLFFSLLSLLAAFLFLFSGLDLVNKLLSLLMVALFLFSIFNFKWGFLSIIFLRPILDLSVNNVIFDFHFLTINALSLLGFLMVFLSIMFIIINRASWSALKNNYLFYAWLVFLFIGILTLFNSFYLFESVKELFRFLSIFSAFLVGFLLLRDPRDLSNLIKVIIWSALPPAILGLFQVLNKTGLPEGQIYRVFGSMTHPNMLAFFLILAISMSLFLVLNIRKTRLEVYIYSFLGIFYIFILFFTYTRGAYLALLAVFALVGMAKFKKFLIFGFLFLIFIYALVPPVQSRFNSIFKADPYGSVAWRFDLWRDGYSYFQNRPWQGYGLGTAERIIASQRDFRLGSPDPHNDYLKIVLDGGYPLLFSYLILILFLFISFWRNYWREDRPRLKNFFLFFAAFSVSIFAMSSGDNILNDTALQWQLWALAGASFACARLKTDLKMR